MAADFPYIRPEGVSDDDWAIYLLRHRNRLSATKIARARRTSRDAVRAALHRVDQAAVPNFRLPPDGSWRPWDATEESGRHHDMLI